MGSLSGGWVEPVEDQGWAADLAALETANGAVHADGRGAVIEFDHDALDAVEVAGCCVVVDPHAVADVQHRERFVGVDRLEQFVAGVDGF